MGTAFRDAIALRGVVPITGPKRTKWFVKIRKSHHSPIPARRESVCKQRKRERKEVMVARKASDGKADAKEPHVQRATGVLAVVFSLVLLSAGRAWGAYANLGNDRVLLMNNDTRRVPFGGVANQGYYDTNSTLGVTYWTHEPADDNKIPLTRYLLHGTNHVLHAADGTPLWQLVDCRAGHVTSGATGRNYIPWSANYAQRSVPPVDRVGSIRYYTNEVNSCVLMRNSPNAVVYSPMYEEGIGTIYADVVNSYVTDANCEIVLEIATNVTTAAAAEGVIFSTAGVAYDKYDWQQIPMTVLSVENGSIASISNGVETLVLNVTEGGTAHYFRIRTQLNHYGPIRFRIRRMSYDQGANADRTGLIALDNIIASYPPMTIRFERYGKDYDDSLMGSEVLGCVGDFNVPFLSAGAQDICARVNFSWVTNNAAVAQRITLSSPQFHYRWRYLNQLVDDWKTLPLVPYSSRLDVDNTATQLVTAVDVPLNQGVGDLEYFFTADIDAQYYSVRDYANDASVGFGEGWTEQVTAVTNRVAYDTSMRKVPSGGTDYFTRIREGECSLEWVRIVGELSVPNAASGSTEVILVDSRMELVGDHQWRCHYEIPKNGVGGTLRFCIVNKEYYTNAMDSGTNVMDSATWHVRTNMLCAADGELMELPYSVILSPGFSHELNVALDDVSTHLKIEYNDKWQTLVLARANYQDFNQWTGALNGFVLAGGASSSTIRYNESLTDLKTWFGWNFHAAGWDGAGDAGPYAYLNDYPDGLSLALNFSAQQADNISPAAKGIGLAEPTLAAYYAQQNPFVQCAELSTGIGTVRFRARLFDTNVTCAVITLYGGTDPGVDQPSTDSATWHILTNFFVTCSTYQPFEWTSDAVNSPYKAVRLSAAGARWGRYPSGQAAAWEWGDIWPKHEPINRVFIDDVSVSEDTSLFPYVEIGPSITTGDLPDAVEMVEYYMQLEALGGVAPYEWEAVAPNYEVARSANSFAETGVDQDWGNYWSNKSYELPFAFPFYGREYSSVYVGNNGVLSFEREFTSTSPDYYGAGSITNYAAIGVLWDWYSSPMKMFVDATSDHVSFRWQSRGVYASTECNFSATLYSNGCIRLSYGSGKSTYATAAISAGDTRRFTTVGLRGSGIGGNASDVLMTPCVAKSSALMPEGLSMTASGLLHGMMYNACSGRLMFRVIDSEGRSDIKELPFTVAANPNKRPVIESIAPQNNVTFVRVGDSRTFSVAAYDPEGGALSYRWTVDGENVDGANAADYTYSPVVTDAGNVRTLTCFVSDGLWTDKVATNFTVKVPRTIYVDAASTNEEWNVDGSTPELAYRDLDRALENVELGDTVFVASGTYEIYRLGSYGVGYGEPDAFITVKSLEGPENTTLTGYIENSNHEVGWQRDDWARYYNGYGESGYDNALPVLDGFTLRSNYVIGGMSLVNCTVKGNEDDEAINGLVGCRLSNCIVTGCRSRYSLLRSCELINCTVAGNVVSGDGNVVSGDGCYAVDEGSLVLDSIVYGNVTDTGEPANYNFDVLEVYDWERTEDGGYREWTVNVPYVVLTNSCTYPLPTMEGSAGNIADDPRLVDVATGDLRLRVGSPCIVDGIQVMGAYLGEPVAGLIVPVRIEGHGTITPLWAIVENGGTATFEVTDFTRQFLGFYTNGVFATAGATLVWRNIAEDGIVSAVFSNYTFHVDAATGNDANDGLSWMTAKASIQAAIAEAVNGETIYVKAGTYSPIDSNDKRIRIESVEGKFATFIDGGGTNRCATLGSTTNTLMRGFTLTNGRADYGGGAYYGTLEDCDIVGNTATVYGGGFCHSDARRCRILDNEVQGTFWYAEGGGAYRGRLRNCVVVGNTAQSSERGEGGGTYYSTCYNCTIVSNSVFGTRCEGGGAYGGSLHNTIVYGNLATNVPNEVSWSSGTYNSLVGVDPLFADGDYRLAAGSPCIDAGRNSYNAERLDLACAPRMRNGVIDIGAYEYQFAPKIVLTPDYSLQNTEESSMNGTILATKERLDIGWSIEDYANDNTNLVVACYVNDMPWTVVTNQSAGVFHVWYDTTGFNRLQMRVVDDYGASDNVSCLFYVNSGIEGMTSSGEVVAIPRTWISRVFLWSDELIEQNPTAVSALLNSMAANGRLSVVDCYVLGLDPQKAENDLKITSFPMKTDGTPDLANIEYDPPHSQWNVLGARAVVKGAATLDGEWKSVEGATAAEKAAMRFFKVVVEVQ